MTDCCGWTGRCAWCALDDSARMMYTMDGCCSILSMTKFYDRLLARYAFDYSATPIYNGRLPFYSVNDELLRLTAVLGVLDSAIIN